MNTILSLTVFVGAILPLVILALLYRWLARRAVSPSFWRTTSMAAPLLAVARTTLVYGGFYTAADPSMPNALRACALICGMLLLPETVLFVSRVSPHAPLGEQLLMLAAATFAGAILWTFALAGLARWRAGRVGTSGGIWGQAAIAVDAKGKPLPRHLAQRSG